jgi:hypothetical protein
VTADAADKNLGSYFGKMQQAVFLAGKRRRRRRAATSSA